MNKFCVFENIISKFIALERNALLFARQKCEQSYFRRVKTTSYNIRYIYIKKKKKLNKNEKSFQKRMDTTMKSKLRIGTGERKRKVCELIVMEWFSISGKESGLSLEIEDLQ